MVSICHKQIYISTMKHTATPLFHKGINFSCNKAGKVKILDQCMFHSSRLIYASGGDMQEKI